MEKDKALQKRKKLQKRLEIGSRLSLIEDVLTFLDLNAIPHGVEFDDPVSAWISSKLPIHFARIDWDNVAGGIVVNYESAYHRNEALIQALNDNLHKDDIVSIGWANAMRPIIEIRVETLINYPDIFANQDSDMWIVNFMKCFCLECYHEGYIGYVSVS